MPDGQSSDDLKGIWQNQPAGTSTMTLKLIHSKARDLRAKTRQKVLRTLAGPLTVAFCYVVAMRAFPQQGHLLPMFAGALVWSLIGLYFLNRGMWSPVMPGDAGLRTGLEFCREEIERQRNLLRRVLLWSLGPILLSLATLISTLAIVGSNARGLLPNGLPFLTLVVVWIIVYFVMRAREQRELDREIEELDDLARDA